MTDRPQEKDDCIFLKSGRPPPPGFDVDGHLRKLGRSAPLATVIEKAMEDPTKPYLSDSARPLDSLHLPAIQAGGATCVVLGLVGFVTTILSSTALTYLGLAACGVALVLGCLALQIQQHGLLRFLSPELSVHSSSFSPCSSPSVLAQLGFS